MKKIVNYILAIVVVCVAVSSSHAQRSTFELNELGIFPSDNSTVSSSVNCVAEFNVIEKNLIEANKKRQTNGYSVQIYFGSGTDARTKAEEAKKNFLELYDDEEAVIIYESPYFKVRAGNFRTRLDATKLKKRIISNFPGCFVVESVISYPKL
ncbi:MAG: SPOR domain-containing protein [Bacteroidales bacterium]|nr:SPOR domain-containing protein [Bacteroidales bacterium]